MNSLLAKKLGRYHRRLHKFAFYFSHAGLELLPNFLLEKDYKNVLADMEKLTDDKRVRILSRCDYYHRLNSSFHIDNPDAYCGNFPRQKPSAYYYDLAPLLHYFPEKNEFHYEFGDVIHVPKVPSFVKSRPIMNQGNENSILLKLDSVRHFYVLPDHIPFKKKKSMLLWRGAAHQTHRLDFLERYHHLPRLDVACVHEKSRDKVYHGSYLTIPEQLEYKYILSIEGNDVATNLKWIFYSNSLCFMCRPRYETWLMEGALEPNVHYVLLRDDYADIEEKLDYFESHPEAALEIIHNAQMWMQQFMDKDKERLLSLLVMEKYFRLSGQL